MPWPIFDQVSMMRSDSALKGCSEGGQQIGPYTNATFHENGLFSTVYKAYSDSNQLVALKVTTPSKSKAPHNPLREARILRHAVHPSVISLLSAFPADNGHFILAFPFFALDLQAWITARRNRPPEHHTQSASKLLYGLLSALAHIHSLGMVFPLMSNDLFSILAYTQTLGIIHRDVKPANILVASDEGPAYLADFGIAWTPEESEPVDKKITDVGTTCYRPPELLFGHTSYDCTLDMWAAGCVIAEVFSGRHGTLFKSGELGSDFALIFSIFSTLGTPTSSSWPV